MKYILLLCSLFAPLSGSAQIPIDSVKAIAQRQVACKRSKGIIVGIVNANGRYYYSAGVTSDSNLQPPDSSTIFEIGSITKVFASLLLADMSNKQQLQLYNPISTYLPGIQTPTRNGREITLLHLSTHRSGLPRTAYNLDPKNLDNPYAEYGETALYEYLANVVLTRDIGVQWAYSNIGYALLGHILCKVGGQDFETLVKRNICDPLQLPNTTITLSDAQRKHLAQGHSEYGKPAVNWTFPLPAGGAMLSNTDDLLTFAAANLGFMETELRSAMDTSHVKRAKKDGNETYTTMGWTLWDENGRHILFKDGGTGGYRTFLGIDKKNLFGVVVLTNSNNIITETGLHIMDSTAQIKPYKYPWNLLDTLRVIADQQGSKACIKQYHQFKQSANSHYVFNEHQLNYLGRELLREGHFRDAIRIYQLNIEAYPNSTLVYESLGEAYKRNHRKKKAKAYFEKAMSLDPENPHWRYILESLK